MQFGAVNSSVMQAVKAVKAVKAGQRSRSGRQSGNEERQESMGRLTHHATIRERRWEAKQVIAAPHIFLPHDLLRVRDELFCLSELVSDCLDLCGARAYINIYIYALYICIIYIYVWA
jgi:hypothetical protein